MPPLIFAFLLLAPAEQSVDVRNDIVNAYRRSLDALARGDADSAVVIDTSDWVGITPGQPPLRLRTRDSWLRQNIASQRPPAGWVATWHPDYEHNGATTGIQIYDAEVDRNTAIVLCLVTTGLETRQTRKAHPQRAHASAAPRTQVTVA